MHINLCVVMPPICYSVFMFHFVLILRFFKCNVFYIYIKYLCGSEVKPTN